MAEIDHALWRGLIAAAVDDLEVEDVACETHDCLEPCSACRIAVSLGGPAHLILAGAAVPSGRTTARSGGAPRDEILGDLGRDTPLRDDLEAVGVPDDVLDPHVDVADGDDEVRVMGTDRFVLSLLATSAV